MSIAGIAMPSKEGAYKGAPVASRKSAGSHAQTDTLRKRAETLISPRSRPRIGGHDVTRRIDGTSRGNQPVTPKGRRNGADYCHVKAIAP